jgi:hypothetical protein
MTDNMKLINKWLIGKSVLCEGISIPYIFQKAFFDNLDTSLLVGDTKFIKIQFSSYEFEIKLQNQHFSRKKYRNHVPIIRLMYGNSKFSDFLKENFKTTWSWLKLNKINGRYPRINQIPNSIKEYLAIYSTNKKNIFYGKCITANEIAIYNNNFINLHDEETNEFMLNYSHQDENANIIEKQSVQKIRKLDRNLIENLKKTYNYRCQICKTNFIEKYNTKIAEAHHIKPFVESYNNDSCNLMILCPNHHRLIHRAKPNFKRKQLTFTYPNGTKEKLSLNKHLNF